MNNYEFLIIFIPKIESLTAISMMMSLMQTSLLVTKNVFIVEEQLCKSVWQLVKG